MRRIPLVSAYSLAVMANQFEKDPKMASVWALRGWANTVDRTQRTSPGRAAFEASFLAKVNPAITDPEQRAKAAAELRRAYYLELGMKGAKARRDKARRNREG